MANTVEVIFTAKDLTGKGLTKVNKGLGLMGKNLGKLNRQFFSLKGLVATAGVGLIAKSFIDAADTSEQFGVRLSVLLGSVEEGNRLFQEMTEYAGQVPHEFEGIMESATQLSGILEGGVDEIAEWMPLIGDLAATSGLSIQKTTEQVSRMLSAGAASADLFRERGITAMLGFQAGVSVSVEETRKQLMSAWDSPLSKFRGASDKLATTWTGIMSMISDKWFQLRTTIMSAGLLDFFKAIAGTIDNELGNALDRSKTDAEQWVGSFISFVEAFAMGAAGMVDALAAPTKRLGEIISFFWEGFKALPSWVQEIGVVGALLGGYRGKALILALAGGARQLQSEIKFFTDYQEGRVGFWEWFAGSRFDLDEKLDKLHAGAGKVVRLAEDGTPITELLIPEEGELESASESVATYFNNIRTQMATMKAEREAASAGGGRGAGAPWSFDWDEYLEETQDGFDKSNAILARSLQTDREIYIQEYEQRLVDLEDYHLTTEQSDTDYQARKEQLYDEHLQNMDSLNDKALKGSFAFGKAMRDEEYGDAVGHFSDMYQMKDAANEDEFKIAKAAALAKATVALPSAVMQSYDSGGGWPWGLIPAGLMLVAGLKEISKINNTSYSKAHSGITNVSRDATFELQAGERVIKRDQNRDLTDFLEGGGEGGGGVRIETLNMNMYLPAESLRDIDPTEAQEIIAEVFIPAMDALSNQGTRLNDFSTGEQL